MAQVPVRSEWTSDTERFFHLQLFHGSRLTMWGLGRNFSSVWSSLKASELQNTQRTGRRCTSFNQPSILHSCSITYLPLSLTHPHSADFPLLLVASPFFVSPILLHMVIICFDNKCSFSLSFPDQIGRFWNCSATLFFFLTSSLSLTRCGLTMGVCMSQSLLAEQLLAEEE